jgi:hypothetical protein
MLGTVNDITGTSHSASHSSSSSSLPPVSFPLEDKHSNNLRRRPPPFHLDNLNSRNNSRSLLGSGSVKLHSLSNKLPQINSHLVQPLNNNNSNNRLLGSSPLEHQPSLSSNNNSSNQPRDSPSPRLPSLRHPPRVGACFPLEIQHRPRDWVWEVRQQVSPQLPNNNNNRLNLNLKQVLLLASEARLAQLMRIPFRAVVRRG